MRTLIFFSALFISFVGQTQTTQIVNIGGPGESYWGNDVHITEQGDVILSINLDIQAQLMYLNDSYETQWIVAFDSTSALGEIQVLSDGSYFTYYQDAPGFDKGGVIVKFDSTGITWAKRVGDGINNAAIYGITQLSNGNLAFIVRDGAPWNIVILDQSGNLVWDKSYSGVYNVGLKDIIATNDGNLLLLGNESFHISSGLAPRHELTKLDNNGNIIWQKSYETLAFDGFNSIYESNAGNIYALGHYDTTASGLLAMDLIIRSFDSNGDILGERVYTGPFADYNLAGSMTEDDEGNIMCVASSKPLYNCAGNLMCLKIAANLDTLMVKNYGLPSGAGSTYQRLHKVGNQYYSLGYGGNWSIGGGSQAHLLLTNDNFDLPCLLNQLNYQVYSPEPYIPVSTGITIGPAVSNILTDEAYSTIPAKTIWDACTGQQLGTNDLLNEFSAIELGPNPAHDLLYVRVNNKDYTITGLKIFSTIGQLEVNLQPKNDQELIIDITHLSNGIHHVQITTGSTIVHKKLLINH